MARSADILRSTFDTYGSTRLASLCRAVGLDASGTDDMVSLFRYLISPWGDGLIGDRTEWRSDIGMDGSPYEFSVALSEVVPEVRILVEAQSQEGTIEAHTRAARAMLDRLESDLAVSLDRFRAIEDLFLPEEPEGRFTLWHAAVMRPGEPLMMKIYLNPKVRGERNAPDMVRWALDRLGLGSSWPSVAAACARGRGLDDLKYFSLDLTAQREARVKVYVFHKNTNARELENVASLAKTYEPGVVTDFVRTITGTEGISPGATICTCLSFQDTSGRPAVTSVYVPFQGRVRDDIESRDRVHRFLAEHGGDVQSFDRALEAFPDRPLGDAAGMLGYVSLRNGKGKPRVTVYLNPELYSGATSETRLVASPFLAALERTG